MRFCEASAKDNFNVDEIFLKLVDDILRKVKASGACSSTHVTGQCVMAAGRWEDVEGGARAGR